MTTSVVWISSAPKSGNTWVRFLLTHLLYPAQRPAERHVHQCVPSPSSTQRLALPKEATVCLKTHACWGEPLSALHVSQGLSPVGALHIVRHPADVLQSMFHFALLRSSVPGVTRPPEIIERFHAMFIEQIMAGLDEGEGWLAHWRTWAEAPIPRLLLRYEDLREAPHAQLQRIATFLGAPLSSTRAEEIIAACAFSRLQSMEERHGARAERIGVMDELLVPGAVEDNRRFFRRGQAGEGGAWLTLAERAQLVEALAEPMAQLGYGLDVATGAHTVAPLQHNDPSPPPRPPFGLAEVTLQEQSAHEPVHLGMRLAILTRDERAERGLTGEHGLVIESVAPDGPAERAGVQAWDIVHRLDGAPATKKALLSRVRNARSNDTLSMSLQRDDETLELTVTFARRPPQTQA